MNTSRGLTSGLAAYGLWGLLPLYWKLLGHIPALEILCHRMFWAVFAVGLVLAATSGWKGALTNLRSGKHLLIFLCSALLIGLNWFTYIWAVNADLVLEASFGYFINPLMTVLFGLLFFKERLRPLQICAVVLAACGVAYMTFQVGEIPVVGLTLSGSFAVYTVIRKLAPAGSLDGLFTETTLLCLPALLMIIFLEAGDSGHFIDAPLSIQLLLIGAGPMTAVPLLFFADAARNLPFSTLGLLQYSAPTIQFFLALFVFDEPFSIQKFFAFCFIWSGLLVYSADGLWFRRHHAVKTSA